MDELVDISRPPQRTREIILRRLEGQLPAEIAAYYRLPIEQIRKVLASKAFHREKEKLEKLVGSAVVERVSNLGDEALDTVRDTMRGENLSELKLKAAKDILDRNPVFRPKDSAKEFEGLGESIIRAIARRIADQHSTEAPQTQEIASGEIDVTPKEGEENGGISEG